MSQRGFAPAGIVIALAGLLLLIGIGGIAYLSDDSATEEPSVEESENVNFDQNAQLNIPDGADVSYDQTQKEQGAEDALPEEQTKRILFRCEFFFLKFNEPSRSFEQTAAALEAFYETGEGLEQVQFLLSAYYGIPQRDIVTGSMNQLTRVKLMEFQKERGLLESGKMNLLTQTAMQKPCAILADRDTGGVIEPLVTNDTVKGSASVAVVSSDGPGNKFFEGEEFFVTLRLTNNDPYHAARIGVPFCHAARTQVFSVQSSGQRTTLYDSTNRDVSNCDASKIVRSVILPGETTAIIGVRSDDIENLGTGTFEAEMTPLISPNPFGTGKKTFTIGTLQY